MNKLVCGRLKQGKTTLAEALAYRHSLGVVVWDPRHMLQGVIVTADATHTLAENLEEAIQDKLYAQGPLVVWPSRDIEIDFAQVCSVLFNPPERFSAGGFAFVVDEAADLQKAQSINAELRVVVKQHPRSVLVVQCTHSLQEFQRSSKDTMSDLYCFRLQGRSLTAVVEYCDVDDEDELREAIKTLPDHAYVHVDFEAEPGAASWAVCDPLPLHVVDALQKGLPPHARNAGDVTHDHTEYQYVDER